MTNINVNFADITGTIRPLHGVNNCTRKALWDDLTDDFKALKLPIVRLHDTGGAYGGTYYVDVPNIFPHFDADPEDPASYDFELTDLYLKYLVESGSEVMYRLGVTIEHAPKKYRIFPPADPHKWADICEHIVRHYNKGWANGYHWNIKYWEIWNEPDGNDPLIEPHGEPMWIGTDEQYFELYSIAANHLKKNHPEILVGGYSGCSISGEFHNGEWVRGRHVFLYGFLDYITTPETRAPLDFFSWHTYIFGNSHAQISYVTTTAEFARETLDRYGFTDTLLFNTEWNCYLHSDRQLRLGIMKTEKGAACYAAVMCEMQKRGLMDSAMFYAAGNNAGYNALYQFPTYTPTKSYHAFRFFGEVYALHNECRVEWEDASIYAAASASEGEGVLMLANPEPKTSEISLHLTGIDIHSAEISILDADRDGEASPIDAASLAALTLPPHSVALIRVK